MKVKYPYRIFISFSHGDDSIARSIRSHLADLGAIPMSDHNLDPSVNFTEEIKKFISYAHIFLPILSLEGSKRPQVHQEIGFALGMGIPILPVAVGALPDGLTQQIQAISLLDNLSNLSEKISSYTIEKVINRTSSNNDKQFLFVKKNRID